MKTPELAELTPSEMEVIRAGLQEAPRRRTGLGRLIIALLLLLLRGSPTTPEK